jgi:hypothetical protein
MMKRYNSALTTNDLMALLEAVAKRRADGHITILKFTTGWKCMVGTPDLNSGCRKEIRNLQSYKTLREAIIAELKRATKERWLLRSLQQHYEGQMTSRSYAEISRKLDCVQFMLDN